jgi:hypothetical protein
MERPCSVELYPYKEKNQKLLKVVKKEMIFVLGKYKHVGLRFPREKPGGKHLGEG